MKIAVLASGGVDSAVALKMLKDQGHDVTAFYIKIWLEDELSFLGECPWSSDLLQLGQVCNACDVPLEVLSLQREYWDTVVSYSLAEVSAGRTPNPDVLCNRHIKFGLFYNSIPDEFEKVATGHYAKLVRDDKGLLELYRTPDAIKDQTYFLSCLDQKQLERAMFPLGEMCKSKVRKLAEEYDLPNKDRKDSQGICFLGKLKFSDFLKHHLGERPGKLVEFETGEVLGEHKGFWYYTIGQRRGSGLGGGPWYVVDKDPDKNIVFVSRNYFSGDKKRDTFEASSCHWIGGKRPDKKDLKVKLRHGPHIYDAKVDYIDDERVKVVLSEHDQGIAPGQYAVFYDDKLCLGCGVISG